MFSDITVTVSSSIVRDIEKGFAVLEMIRIIDGTADNMTEDHFMILLTTVGTIEKLFLLEEDLLVDESEFGFFLCKKLSWYEKLLSKVDDEYFSPEDTIIDAYETLETFIAGEAVDPDFFDDATHLCKMISDAIWSHFIQLHYETTSS